MAYQKLTLCTIFKRFYSLFCTERPHQSYALLLSPLPLLPPVFSAPGAQIEKPRCATYRIYTSLGSPPPQTANPTPTYGSYVTCVPEFRRQDIRGSRFVVSSAIKVYFAAAGAQSELPCSSSSRSDSPAGSRYKGNGPPSVSDRRPLAHRADPKSASPNVAQQSTWFFKK